MKTTQEFLFNIITEDQYQEYEQEMNKLDDRKFITYAFYPTDLMDLHESTNQDHTSEKDAYKQLEKVLEEISTYVSIGEENAQIMHRSIVKKHCDHLIDDGIFSNTSVFSHFDMEEGYNPTKKTVQKRIKKWVTYIDNPTYSAYIITQYLDHRVELGINE